MADKKYAVSLDDEGGKRHAYRATVSGIKVRVNKGADFYDLEDLSATGCSFAVPNMTFTEGDAISLQFMVRSRVILAGLEAHIVRIVRENIVACSFANLTSRQEYALDKFVLEIQKRIIALQKI